MTSINYTIRKRTKRKLYGIAGALLTLVIPFFFMLGNADHHLDTAQSLCPFKLLTGFPCPGCGITKSMVYFYEGDLHKSLNYHILGPFALLFCIAAIIILCTELYTGKEYFGSVLYSKKLGWTLAILLIVYHIYRLVIFISNNDLDSILRQSVWK